MKTTRFDVSEYLDNEEMIVEYLTAVLEENDVQLFVQAIGNVARARGMTQTAKEAGLGRQSLYKALSGEKKPRLETVFKVLEALGVRLSVQSMPADKTRAPVSISR